jgi:hypothetical protein
LSANLNHWKNSFPHTDIGKQGNQMDFDTTLQQLRVGGVTPDLAKLSLRKAGPPHTTVAHALAEQGLIFTELAILTLADDLNWTVAHELALKGHSFDDPEIQKLTTHEALSVAVLMVRKGHTVTDPSVLRLMDCWGKTLAHELVDQGVVFSDTATLAIRSKEGWTVAHELASRGQVFDKTDILMLATPKGWTVGHEMAWQGHPVVGPDGQPRYTVEGHPYAISCLRSGVQEVDPSLFRVHPPLMPQH